jgi:hypothetical protein
VVSVLLVAGVKEGINTYQTLFSGPDSAQSVEIESDEEIMQFVRRPGRRRPDEAGEAKGEAPVGESNADSEQVIVKLPPALQYLANLDEPKQPTDKALFWAVPRSGGSTVKSIVGHCFKLTIASEAGADATSNELTVITDLEGGKYINVNVATVKGIERAKQLNLAASPQLDLIATPFFFEASKQLFSNEHKGRAFTMLRHPIDRSASMYYFLTSDPIETLVSPGMSLVDYAKSDLAESNWYTRFLTGTMDGELTKQHLSLAKEILRTKFIIGLLTRKGESLRRFGLFFEWAIRDERMEECHGKLLDWDWPNKNKHPPIKEGSEAWRALMKNNEYDLQLYEFAEELFREQAKLFQGAFII